MILFLSVLNGIWDGLNVLSLPSCVVECWMCIGHIHKCTLCTSTKKREHNNYTFRIQQHDTTTSPPQQEQWALGVCVLDMCTGRQAQAGRWGEKWAVVLVMANSLIQLIYRSFRGFCNTNELWIEWSQTSTIHFGWEVDLRTTAYTTNGTRCMLSPIPVENYAENVTLRHNGRSTCCFDIVRICKNPANCKILPISLAP